MAGFYFLRVLLFFWIFFMFLNDRIFSSDVLLYQFISKTLFFLFLSSINLLFRPCAWIHRSIVTRMHDHYYIACLKFKFLFHRRNIFRAPCPSGSTLDGP